MKMNIKCSSLRLATFVCVWLSLSSSINSDRRVLTERTSQGVKLIENPNNVVLDNGIVQVTLSKPDGFVTAVKYNGVENILDHQHKEDSRGYWDIVWSKPGEKDIFDKLSTTKFAIITQNAEQIEVSFSRQWTSFSDKLWVPLNVDKRYIVKRGKSGFYAYAIMERLAGAPEVNMNQFRMVFKLPDQLFKFMVVSENIRRSMPTVEEHDAGQKLLYPEASILTNPSNFEQKGEVDDKYQYSMELRDRKVHGWVSFNPSVGIWMIRPSDEFCIGGPTRQDLTSHAGPNLLAMFTSLHYAGKDLNTLYANGEVWKKVFGPVFIYLNSMPVPAKDYKPFWEDAKKQTSIEVDSWPYNFIQSKDFPGALERGSISGQLILENEGNSKVAKNAYVGLTLPGKPGAWQFDTKGYQFWTQADTEGKFIIKNVRAGDYSLNAWVPGFIGDYQYEGKISIKPGANVALNVLKFRPPRNGPTLWEIGIPDRSAAEFFIPDPPKSLQNRYFVNMPFENYRQYGIWERYTDLYPNGDLVYDVAKNNYSKDWFYAHVPRVKGQALRKTTWKIAFNLPQVQGNGNYTLQLSIASGSQGSVLVAVKGGKNKRRPVFNTGIVGEDNAIARHGIHGLYWLYSISISSNKFVSGKNTIFLTQSRIEKPFSGVMYDYIRLEAPST